MGFVAFVVSLLACSALASLLDVDSSTSQSNTPDYHFVPYAGDAFGA